jgi:Stress responsive A/B Barrel Domain
MFAHNVYFTLHDSSDAAKRTLVDACKKYLTAHPGTVVFACGLLAEGAKRPVNDREFDVSLQMLFATEADHDAYQSAPRHVQFVEENRANWARVRVFDSEVERVP